jgi:hypothetical protein
MKKYYLCYILFVVFMQDSYAVPISKVFPAIVPSFFISPDVLSSTGNSMIDSASLIIGEKHSLKKDNKISFLNRISIKHRFKKIKRQLSDPDVELTPADKKAKNSMIVGIVALIVAIIPFYTILLAIPLGIAAIVMGNKAKKMGTKKKTGIGFAIAAIIIVTLWVIAIGAYVGWF